MTAKTNLCFLIACSAALGGCLAVAWFTGKWAFFAPSLVLNAAAVVLNTFGVVRKMS